MNAELIKSWAALLDVFIWPITLLVIFFAARGLVWPVVKQGGRFSVKVKDVAEVSVEHAQGLRPPGAGTADPAQLTKTLQETPQVTGAPLPLDYFFLNHTSFLRPEKQEEFRRRTGLALDHYDIRVIVDSYYRGALDRVETVEYILHRAYPQPIQYRRDPADKFLLKELANGEYVLKARVFLKDRREPVLLQRYITLWPSGPCLP